jgi:hypothetical protein
MVKVMVIREWTDASLKLGGSNVRIRRAWFGVPNDPSKQVDVTTLLEDERRANGFAWLTASIFKFGDPARFTCKRLIVVFEGDNDYGGGNLLWGTFVSLATSSVMHVAMKGIFIVVFGPAGVVAVGHSHVGLYLGAGSASLCGLKAWWKSSGCPSPGSDDCAICTDEDMDYVAVPCRHRFHQTCFQHWCDTCAERGQPVSCPLCREILSKESGTLRDVANSDNAAHGLMSLNMAHLAGCLNAARLGTIHKGFAAVVNHGGWLVIVDGGGLSHGIAQQSMAISETAFIEPIDHVLSAADYAQLFLFA